jgi:hypothetical protein
MGKGGLVGIYSRPATPAPGDAWRLESRLEGGHEEPVTSIDWTRVFYGDDKTPVDGNFTDRIITVSSDRNGYVWSRSSGKFHLFDCNLFCVGNP